MQKLPDVHLLGTVVWHTTEPSLATELQAKGQPVPENHKVVSLRVRDRIASPFFHLSGLLARVPRHFPTPKGR